MSQSISVALKTSLVVTAEDNKPFLVARLLESDEVPRLYRYSFQAICIERFKNWMPIRPAHAETANTHALGLGNRPRCRLQGHCSILLLKRDIRVTRIRPHSRQKLFIDPQG